MHWYRCVVDRNTGKVASFERVEAAGDNNADVFYVRASSDKEAARLAFNAYCRVRLRARRAKLAAEGKCRCGAARDVPGKKRCRRCLEKTRLYDERHEAKKRGETVPPLDRKVAHQERREQECRELEESLLCEVETAVDACRTIGEVRRWLRERLAKVRGRRAA